MFLTATTFQSCFSPGGRLWNCSSLPPYSGVKFTCVSGFSGEEGGVGRAGGWGCLRKWVEVGGASSPSWNRFPPKTETEQ